MKETEIQCGDIILVDGKPTRVYGVMERMNRIYDTMTNDISLKRCSGMPLTPEILEKNGWKLRRGYPTEYEFIRSDYVHFYYDVKHKHCVIEVWEEICVDILLDTVHTLQHALRLCGVEEFADNIQI